MKAQEIRKLTRYIFYSKFFKPQIQRLFEEFLKIKEENTENGNNLIQYEEVEKNLRKFLIL